MGIVLIESIYTFKLRQPGSRFITIDLHVITQPSFLSKVFLARYLLWFHGQQPEEEKKTITTTHNV